MTDKKTKFLVFLAVFFISFSPIIIRYTDAPALIIAFYRMFFTVIMMSFYIASGNRIEMSKFSKKELVLSLVSGVFLALHFAAWISSLDYTTVASSTVLVNIQPIIVFLLTLLILKDRFSLKKLLIILIVFIGSLLISYGDFRISSEALYGDFLAVVGAFFVAFYMIIGKLVRKNVSALNYTFVVYSTSAIVLLIINIFLKNPLTNYSFREYLLIFLLALTANILGHSILNWALKYLDPTFVSTSILGEPVFATLWAYILFNEYLKIWHFIGGFIVIVGIYIFNKVEKANVNNDKEKSFLDL